MWDRGRSDISKFHTKFKNILRLRISYAILIKKSVHSFSETELNIFVMLRAVLVIIFKIHFLPIKNRPATIVSPNTTQLSTENV